MVYHPLRSMTVNTKKIVTCPNINDVLCGRGSGPYSHPGNKLFRDVVAEHKISYNTVDNHLKTFIAKEVVQFIHNQSPPGIFLSQSGGTWYEVPYDVAVQKTKQALREKTKWAKNDEHIATNDETSKSSANQSSKRRRRRCIRTNSAPSHRVSYMQTPCPADNQIIPLHSKVPSGETTQTADADLSLEESREALLSLEDNIQDLHIKFSKLDDIDKLIIDMLHEDNIVNNQNSTINSCLEKIQESLVSDKKFVDNQQSDNPTNQIMAIAA